MGAEVSLVGIRGANPEYAYPRVELRCEEMGFRGLSDALVWEARNGDLLEWVDADRGFHQFRIRDSQRFVAHVQENPHLWDSVGQGFGPGLKRIELNPDLTWWFHVTF